MNQPTNQPDQPKNQASDRSIEQHTEQSTNQPANQSTEQSTEQLMKQRANRHAEQKTTSKMLTRRTAHGVERWLAQPIGHSRLQGLLITLVIVGLAILYAYKWTAVHLDLAETFWNWIDPVAGISAFVISIAVLYNQARERWESSLEKRLTVQFLNAANGHCVAIVEDAYLAGAADIRQWAQQLGKQIFDDYLDMDMNWDDDTPPRIICEQVDGKKRFAKSYEIALYFDFKDEYISNMKKFAKRKFHHSRVEWDSEQKLLRWYRAN